VHKKWLTLVSICVAVALLLTGATVGCAPAAPAEEAPAEEAPVEVIQWNMWQQSTAYRRDDVDKRVWSNPWNYEVFAERIKRDTNGRLDIRVCLPAELGLKGPEVLRGIKDEIIQMSEVVGVFVSQEVPALGAQDLPFLLDSHSEIPVQMEVLKPYYQQVFDGYNAIVGPHTSPFPLMDMVFMTKKPINNLEDLKGIKMRVFGPYHCGFLSKAGASPVPMPSPEVPQALKTGVIDGVFSCTACCKSFKTWESDAIYEKPVMLWVNENPIAISKAAFNKLPPDVQQIVYDDMAWFQNELDAHHLNSTFSQELIDQCIADYGIVVADYSPEMTATLKGYCQETDWIQWEKDAGPLGTEILDKILVAVGRPRK